MGGFLPYEGEALVEYDLTPAVHSLDQIRAGRPSGPQLGQAAAVSPEDRFRHGTAGHARRRRRDRRRRSRHTPCAQLEGLMTHFASAADYSTDQTADQLAYFHAHGGRTAKRRACIRRSPAYLEHQRHRVRPASTAGTTWCAPGTRSTATSRRRAATRPRNCWTCSRRSPGRPSCWP